MSIYDYRAAAVCGTQVDLSSYRGKVLLIVNTASQCAYSRQFEGLQDLYGKRRGKEFEILGFPCNQFNGREPGDNSEIARACASKGVEFPLFGKIQVRGRDAHPLYQYLTAEAPFRGFDLRTEGGAWMDRFLKEKHPEIYEGDGIKWNFTKFLIDRAGRIRGRFETPVEPRELEALIDVLL
ncbi:glutathione peroxidase [Cohnella fermenti]|uniref:Glutathione peroxidase n=1 Tax=Cohnella fermenti TaxID=2565925 RepID=A0A4V3WEG2_9BACL|nr:glutathione peroxidase [Cohnella fermenti]THF76205.1 glutathione peroxidase [Cohnella fermenti]